MWANQDLVDASSRFTDDTDHLVMDGVHGFWGKPAPTDGGLIAHNHHRYRQGRESFERAKNSW
jgi:hypothetical protein